MEKNQLETFSPAIEKIQPTVLLIFDNNKAQVGVNNIYGGLLDWTIGNGIINYTPSRLSNALKFLDDDHWARNWF